MQRRAEAVWASGQQATYGLGFKIEGLEPGRVTDYELEAVEAAQTPDWLPPCDLPPPSLAEMQAWVEEGAVRLPRGGEGITGTMLGLPR